MARSQQVNVILDEALVEKLEKQMGEDESFSGFVCAMLDRAVRNPRILKHMRRHPLYAGDGAGLQCTLYLPKDLHREIEKQRKFEPTSSYIRRMVAASVVNKLHTRLHAA